MTKCIHYLSFHRRSDASKCQSAHKIHWNHDSVQHHSYTSLEWSRSTDSISSDYSSDSTKVNYRSSYHFDVPNSSAFAFPDETVNAGRMDSQRALRSFVRRPDSSMFKNLKRILKKINVEH